MENPKHGKAGRPAGGEGDLGGGTGLGTEVDEKAGRQIPVPSADGGGVGVLPAAEGVPPPRPSGSATASSLSSREANFDGKRPYGGAEKDATLRLELTCPVASYPANALGLHDMHGNVLEWCADFFAPYPPGEAVNPVGPEEGRSRVLRGGARLHPSWHCRAAYRRSSRPSSRLGYFGFRLARTLPAASK